MVWQAKPEDASGSAEKPVQEDKVVKQDVPSEISVHGHEDDEQVEVTAAVQATTIAEEVLKHEDEETPKPEVKPA